MEEQKRDKMKLIPNKSIGAFKLGDKIERYLNFKHTLFPKNPNVLYDVDHYEFSDFGIVVWSDEKGNFINTIRCDISCIWNGYELINMNYQKFIEIFRMEPDDCSIEYSVGTNINGRYYHVYDFNSLGIMLWVWRNKVRNILIYKCIKEKGHI